MKAKDIMFDFIETIFLILLISFIVFYFIVGDRLGVAEDVIKTVLPFAIFGLLFLSKLKYSRHELKWLDRKSTAEEAVIYPTAALVKWDTRVIIIISLILLLIPFFNKTLSIIDALQVFVFATLMYIWHRHLFFSKGSKIPDKAINRAQINKDEMFIFSLPIIVLVPPLLARDLNTLDVIQALVAITLMFAWRKYFYYKLS